MKIWIDLDNTPHVPFFRPIIHELEQHGHTVVLTARDAFQVCELAARFGLPVTKVGRHYGKNRFLKLSGLAWRSCQLLPFLLRERPDLAVSHGSRSQILLSNILRLPTVMIMDYEHAQTPWILRPRWEIVPDVLLSQELHCKSRDRILNYRGIKEDVYAPAFKPDAGLLKELGVSNSEIMVTVRPPATEAHYHNPEAEGLFVQFMERANSTPNVRVVLLPRNKNQEAEIRSGWPQWFGTGKTLVPKRAVDGLNLVWHSDLVVSGGGTMNREAAALGVPVYSIFRGKLGAVDRQLQTEGRLTLVQNDTEVAAIALRARSKPEAPNAQGSHALDGIIKHLAQILRVECEGLRTLRPEASPTKG